MVNTLHGTFHGTPAQLHARVTGEHKPPQDWPKPRSVAGLLKRNAPALRTAGWTVKQGQPNAHGATLWTLNPPRPEIAAAHTESSDLPANDGQRRHKTPDQSHDSSAIGTVGTSSDSRNLVGTAGPVPKLPTEFRPPHQPDSPTKSGTSELSQPAAAISGRPCSGCGRPLLLASPGRTSCAACTKETA
jgi:hypothetical protein